MEKIILIGGGGHCHSCIDVIETGKKFEIAGIIDVPEKLGTRVQNYPVIGNDNDITSLVSRYNNFFITLGQLTNSEKRRRLFTTLENLKVNIPVIVSPLAHVSNHAILLEGTIVLHQAVINVNVKVGKNCIINSMALLEHDTTVGNHCHISTNSAVNGCCNIGDDVIIGSGSSISNNINIADQSIIGIGSVVTKSIIKSGLYYGNPAKLIN
jgi:sugar O-acyltransferase (sialic acid O-acetyltransferase NeuD family)